MYTGMAGMRASDAGMCMRVHASRTDACAACGVRCIWTAPAFMCVHVASLQPLHALAFTWPTCSLATTQAMQRTGHPTCCSLAELLCHVDPDVEYRVAGRCDHAPVVTYFGLLLSLPGSLRWQGTTSRDASSYETLAGALTRLQHRKVRIFHQHGP